MAHVLVRRRNDILNISVILYGEELGLNDPYQITNNVRILINLLFESNFKLYSKPDIKYTISVTLMLSSLS